jgi:hypothetical protein
VKCKTYSGTHQDTELVNGVPILEWFVKQRQELCKNCWTPPIIVQPTPGFVTIQDKFEEFHRLNPWVYWELVVLTRDLVQRGKRKIGIGMLFEVLRWQYIRSTIDPSSDFKLNNNYRSRYARLIEAQEPDLAGKFETRQLQTP